jgi:mannose-1-phosphate guanylyltransferase
MDSERYVVIMAGGVGSRFWPASTSEKPKQFIDILGIGRTLIQMTYDRVTQIVPKSRLIIVTNHRYSELVKAQLPELPTENILCEPSMNNTAPCVAYAALHIHARHPNATFAVLPSDHVILKEDVYLQILDTAFTFAAQNHALITLGIQPTRPDTGYGYIKFDSAKVRKGADGMTTIYKVDAFREKPDHEMAQSYLASGDYLWNAGMFIWRTNSILEAFEKYCPDILTTLLTEKDVFGTAGEQEYIDRIYPKTQKISIDYAILERAENVYTIPADIGWSDLGTWQSLHAHLTGDDVRGVVSVGRNITLIDSSNIIVMSDNDRTVVIKGLQDYIVVDEKNALLIYPKKDEQEIKEVVRKIEEKS